MTTTRRLTLRLEPSGDNKLITGWLCDERGEERYFTSWLGLLTLLERARLQVRAEARRESCGKGST